jgi:hypothetical protein
MTEFKKLIEASGVTIMEAADLYKTTKQTIYAWRRGSSVPRSLLVKIGVERMNELIKRALERGELPLGEEACGLAPELRLRAIKKILVETAKSN